MKENIKEKKNPGKDIAGSLHNFDKPAEKTRHPADGKEAKAANFKDYGQE